MREHGGAVTEHRGVGGEHRGSTSEHRKSRGSIEGASREHMAGMGLSARAKRRGLSQPAVTYCIVSKVTIYRCVCIAF